MGAVPAVRLDELLVPWIRDSYRVTQVVYGHVPDDDPSESYYNGAKLVAAGAGLGLVPRSQIGPELTVLEPGEYRPVGGPFFLVTPSAGTAPPKVRAFADAARAFVASRPELFV